MRDLTLKVSKVISLNSLAGLGRNPIVAEMNQALCRRKKWEGQSEEEGQRIQGAPSLIKVRDSSLLR